MRFSRVTGTVLATITAGLLSTSAIAFRPMTPLPGHHGRIGPINPPYHAPAGTRSGTWTGLTHVFPGSTPDTALLLTDGTVMMHDACTTDWYRLAPSNTGSYKTGTWTKTAPMPSGYTPLYFASQVLPDGRLIVNGGE